MKSHDGNITLYQVTLLLETSRFSLITTVIK